MKINVIPYKIDMSIYLEELVNDGVNKQNKKIVKVSNGLAKFFDNVKSFTETIGVQLENNINKIISRDFNNNKKRVFINQRCENIEFEDIIDRLLNDKRYENIVPVYMPYYYFHVPYSFFIKNTRNIRLSRFSLIDSCDEVWFLCDPFNEKDKISMKDYGYASAVGKVIKTNQ